MEDARLGRLPLTATMAGLRLRLADVGSPAQVEPVRPDEHAVIVRDAPGDGSDERKDEGWVGITVIERDGRLSHYSVDGMFALAKLMQARTEPGAVIPVARNTRRLTSAAALIDAASGARETITVTLAVYYAEGVYWIGDAPGAGDPHAVHWCPRPGAMRAARDRVVRRDRCGHTYAWVGERRPDGLRRVRCETWEPGNGAFLPCSGRGAVAAAAHVCRTMGHRELVVSYDDAARRNAEEPGQCAYYTCADADSTWWVVKCVFLGRVLFEPFSCKLTSSPPLSSPA